MKYDFKCPQCQDLVEVERTIATRNDPVVCEVCGSLRVRVLTTYPYTKLNWKAYDRNDTGSDRMSIGAAKQGSVTPMDDRAQGYNVVIHDDHRQEDGYK